MHVPWAWRAETVGSRKHGIVSSSSHKTNGMDNKVLVAVVDNRGQAKYFDLLGVSASRLTFRWAVMITLIDCFQASNWLSLAAVHNNPYWSTVYYFINSCKDLNREEKKDVTDVALTRPCCLFLYSLFLQYLYWQATYVLYIFFTLGTRGEKRLDSLDSISAIQAQRRG